MSGDATSGAGPPPGAEVARGAAPGFVQGLLCLPRGAMFLVRRPRMWVLAACPLAINAVLFTLLLVLAVKFLLPALVGWLTPEHAPAFLSPERLPGFLVSVGGALRWLWAWVIWLVCFLLTGVLLVASFTTVGMVLAAPFNDMLSEWVEADLMGRASQRPLTLANLLEDVGRTMGNAARQMLVVVAVFLVTLPLNLVPLVGSLVYTLLNGVVACWYSAMEYVDLPMGRAGWTLRARREWAWARRRGVFGFGVGAYVVLLVPLLGLVVMPAAVAGGTLLYVELGAASGAPPPDLS